MKSANLPSRTRPSRAAVILGACCASVSFLHAAEDYSAWGFSRSIVVNTTAAGAGVTETVTRFPLLVRLTPAQEEVFGNAKAGGADIRFTKADGVTRLPHHIERWDRDARRAAIWVRVDTVHPSGYTTIRMHWSNPAAADSSRGSSVFSLENHFVDVWHLGDATGTAGRPNAAGGPPATPEAHAGPATMTPVEGVAGFADTLRGNARGTFRGEHFDLGDGHDALGDYGTATLSVWAKPAAPAKGTAHMLGFHDGSNLSSLWLGVVGGPEPRLAGQSIFAQNGSDLLLGPPGSLEPDVWQHLTYTLSATGTQSLYRNGTLVASRSGHLLLDIPRNHASLGRSPISKSPGFGGVLDEATVSRVERSEAWIKLSYATQRPDLAAVTVGPAVPRAFIARRVLATEFVSTPRWTVPDYVFDPGYPLRGLAETEDFVRTHRHLPDVPGAARIASEGLDLGEMTLRLLKHVEELTLHVIALDKRAAALERVPETRDGAREPRGRLDDPATR